MQHPYSVDHPWRIVWLSTSLSYFGEHDDDNDDDDDDDNIFASPLYNEAWWRVY